MSVVEAASAYIIQQKAQTEMKTFHSSRELKHLPQLQTGDRQRAVSQNED